MKVVPTVLEKEFTVNLQDKTILNLDVKTQ